MTKEIDYELFEHAGLYDGIEDLARFLTNKIKSHQEKKFRIMYKDTDRELSKFKNVFFKTIVLNCERSNGHDNEASYQINDAIDYIPETDKFLFINIKRSGTICPASFYFHAPDVERTERMQSGDQCGRTFQADPKPGHRRIGDQSDRIHNRSAVFWPLRCVIRNHCSPAVPYE